MGEAPQKRKERPDGQSHDRPAFKKSKGGQAGRWKTPHQKAKAAEKVEMGRILSIEDKGIWVTFARGMNGRAVKEFKVLCEEYGQKLYDIQPPKDSREETIVSDDDGHDIEASIERELEAMKSAPQKPTSPQTFMPIKVDLECLFFMKVADPVDPVRLVREICKDARDCPTPTDRKCKYINRLTPVSATDKATENGVVKVANAVLSPHFNMAKPLANADSNATEEKSENEDIPAHTYAIRHNIRNHSNLTSEFVINKIASMVGSQHKVNLSKPDKVILVEIYQFFCGISVVDGAEWDELKKYNINALYTMTKDTPTK